MPRLVPTRRRSPTMPTQTQHFTLHSRVIPEAYLNVQRKSFHRFLNVGLADVFRPYRDIQVDDAGATRTQPKRRRPRLTLHDRHYRLMRPDLTVRQCLLRRQNYSAPLYVPIEFDIADGPVHVAWFRVMNLPLMTISGHFIVRGIARVILNQVVRSPGVHFQYTPGSTVAQDHGTYHADFIALRGSWLRLEAHEKERGVWAKLKYMPRLPLLPFLRCFGLPSSVINLSLLTGVDPEGKTPACPARLNSGLSRGLKAHYDPPRVGSRLRRDQPHHECGLNADTAAYQPRSWRRLSYAWRGFVRPEAGFTESGSGNRLYDGSRSLVETAYRRFLRRRFWNPRVYTLGSVGRWRLNQTLGLRLPPEQTALSACDVLFGALRLLRCATLALPLNDVDDLQNQAIKPGPSLLQNVVAVGLNEFMRDLRADLTGSDNRHATLTTKFQTALTVPGSRLRAGVARILNPAPTAGNGVPSDPDRIGSSSPRTLQTGTYAIRTRSKPARKRRRGLRSVETRDATDAFAQVTRTWLMRSVDQSLNAFFGTNPLSQLLDETNALAELTHKRRLSSLGVGGITRETAPMAVRSIHPTHYGRICPIETPEGKNAGLVNSLTAYGGVDVHGTIGTPLSQTYRGYVRWDKSPRHVNSGQESRVRVACGDVQRSRYQTLNPNGSPTRHGPDVSVVPRGSVDWVAPVPSQMTSVATGLIPFLEHDDGNRALMGSNMQRQAVPTYGATRPIVGTGGESRAVANVAANVQARVAGLVSYVDSHRAVILRPRGIRSRSARRRFGRHDLPRTRGGSAGDRPGWFVNDGTCRVPSVQQGFATQPDPVGETPWSVSRYALTPLSRSNQDTSRRDRPSVQPGQWVQRGNLVAESTGSDRGDLAVGQNLVVGYSPWEGYNFEDALLINQRLGSDELLTSLHVSRYEIEVRDTPYGYEQITKDDLPEAHRHASWDRLDDGGIVRVGSWVESGDTLVGRVTPLEPDGLTTYHGLLFAVLQRQPKIRETSLVLPHGSGRVVHVERVRPRFDRATALTPITERTPERKARIIRRQRAIGLELLKLSDTKEARRRGRFQRTMIAVVRGDGRRGLRRRSGRPRLRQPQTVRRQSGGCVCNPAYGPRWPKSQLAMRLNAMPTTGARWRPRTVGSAARRSLRRTLRLADRLERRRGYGVRFRWAPRGFDGLRSHRGASFGSTVTTPLAVASGSRRRRAPSRPNQRVRRAKPRRVRVNPPGLPVRTPAATEPPRDPRRRPEPYPSVRVQPSAPGSGCRQQAKARLLTRVVIYVAHEKRIQVGDKLSGRHGNKGIISRLLPRADMPYLPDGTPLDVVLNPLGVPSRMNVGQIFECLLGLAGAYLHQNYRLVPFDEIYGCEASRSLVYAKLYEARLKSRQDWLFDPNFPGKVRLFDGRTGQCFQQPVTVGKAYILKLIHLVDEKIHSRTVGPYSLITQQPLRGRSKRGGQRLGEMEVWALEGFGASYTLQEMMTYKSDDMLGRHQLVLGFQPNRRPRKAPKRRRPKRPRRRTVVAADDGRGGQWSAVPTPWLNAWRRADTKTKTTPRCGWVETGATAVTHTGETRSGLIRKPKSGPKDPSYHMPESFRVLMYELQSLGFQVRPAYGRASDPHQPTEVSSHRRLNVLKVNP